MNLEANWDRLTRLVEDVMVINRDKFARLLYDSKYDSSPGTLGLYRCPAARGRHHAYEGGLVQHMLEMWDLYKKLDLKLSHPTVSDEEVLIAIVVHDFHKVHQYELDGDNYVNHEGEATHLLPDDIWTIRVLARNGIHLEPLQLNALLWAHGGFSEIKPPHCTLLGKLISCLDELSANVVDRARQGKYLK